MFGQKVVTSSLSDSSQLQMNQNQKSSNQAASYFAQAVLGSQQLQLANSKNSKSL